MWGEFLKVCVYIYILYVASSSLGICPDAAEVHGFYEGNHRLLDRFYDEMELLRNRSNHTSLAQQKVEPAKVRVGKDLEPGDTWEDGRFIFVKVLSNLSVRSIPIRVS